MATKLVEWLIGCSIFLGLWTVLLSNVNSHPLLQRHNLLIMYLPFISLVLFGFYALTVVLFRVYTFNNCEKAAAELMEQIKEAKEDLLSKGFDFKEAQ